MIDLIRDLSNASGAAGFEDDVVEVVDKYKGELNLEKDKLMNTYLSYKNQEEKNITFMLDGHLDEVSFMVQYIDSKGMIKFLPLGGWVVENIPAQLVLVKNRDGKYIKGIVSSKPPHFMTEEEKGRKLDISELSIDLGASSREEVINDFKIDIGAPIVPFVEFEYNEDNGTMMGKAFDNRLGCAAVLATMKELEGEDLDVNLLGALACQEEVGTRGAHITANKIKPDLAIVFEGSPADDSFMEENFIQCGLGRGVQIRHRDSSYIGHHKFISLAKRIAEENNIPYQSAVRTGGGTNAGRIHLSGEGVPVLVLGIPVRYIHTHHCYAKIEDFNNTVKLACKIIRAINQESYDEL